MCDGDDSISSKGVSLSTLRQFLPSCHVRPVADHNDVPAEDVSGSIFDPVPSPDVAHDMPVRVPLQLGRLLLHSLLPAGTPSSLSEPPILSDAACSVLLAYLNHNLHLPVNSVTFRAPQPLQRSRFMHIDAHAARALELARGQDVGGQITSGSSSSSSNNSSSVLKQLDQTVTAGGSRCLQAWLLRPLVDVDSIKKRQDAVECLVVRTSLRRDVKDALEGMGDMQRCMQKLLLNRAAPSDAASLARSLQRTLRLKSTLAAACQASNGASVNRAAMLPSPKHQFIRELKGDLPLALQQSAAVLSDGKLQQLQAMLSAAVLDDPPPTPDNFVRPGYSAQYDACVAARDQAAIGMEDVAAQLRADTGISNLKLKCGGGGFFIEVPAASVRMIPGSWVKIAGRGLRYKPHQLMKLEASAAAAAADVAAAAHAVWCEVVAAVGQHSKELGAAAEAVAEVDVLRALAEVAATRDHVRPDVREGGGVWDVRDGRHIVIENLMHKRGSCFIPNSCCLSQPASVMLLSGANMGGKSTFLRQNALIAILAQMGAFVPASAASISIVDRLYCRVG